MLAIRWFKNNYMKLNTCRLIKCHIIIKCHLIVSGNKHEQAWENIGKIQRLEITIGKDLKFGKYVLKLWSKANQ